MKKTSMITAAFLVLIMLLTIIPAGMISAGAESTDPTVNVGSATVKPGSTVDIDVEIVNNPGILGATFTLNYGEGLTLTGVAAGDAFNGLTMTKPGKFTSPCNFTWDGIELSEDQIRDGIILTLTFDVAEEVEGGTVLPVNFSYDDGDVIDGDLNPVTVEINNGTIEVIDYTPGDVDGNLKVNTLDVILVRRYIAGGYDVEIDSRAANVNLDTKVNTLDIILIRRFIAGGYVDANGDPLVLYPAPAEPKPVTSDWVLASEAPAGATIVDEKWTYTQRYTTTSSTNTPPDGYVLCDTTWEWSPWGPWGPWGGRMSFVALDGYEHQQDTRTVTEYNYWIYRTPNGNGWGTQGYSTNQGMCTIYDTVTLDYPLSVTDSTNNMYGYYQSPNFASQYANQWFYGGSVTDTKYRYRERYKIYTYHFEKYEDKESTTDPTGLEDISDIQHWVKYVVN